MVEYSRIPVPSLSRGCEIVCSPNEDFGRMNKRWNPDFRLTFQWFVSQIEYSRPWKVLRKSGFHLLFILPKSSFGMDKLRNFLFAIPRMNKRWNPDFRSTFQWFVAQIEYSRPWKVLPSKSGVLLFLLPKSSFEMDKGLSLWRAKTSHFYPSQTKILEGWTDISECVFDAPFNGL